MSNISYKEIANKSLKELVSLRSDLRKKLMNLRFQKAAGNTAGVSESGRARKSIARINTYINSEYIKQSNKEC